MHAVSRTPHPAPPAAMRAASAAHEAPPTWIRGAVRDVLERTPGYRALGDVERRSLAHAMVRVSSLAARLIDEEDDAHGAIEPAPAPPMARAQSQPDFAAAADRVAQTTHNILNAVSFPRFVTDLINGVFRAMLDSNQAQMQQYVNLLNAVSASTEGFEGAQFGLMRVRQWLADQFPEAIEYDAPEIEPGEVPDPEEIANTRLRLRSGASMPPLEIIRATLGMAPEDPLEAGTPEQLVPLARRHLARQRQQMLATMVTMGMQRIVIDSGKINAAMRFHIDTRSAANQDQGSQTSIENRIKGGGSFGVGPWGASAEVENTIGYVSTQRTQATEEMNTDLELNSSVELNFRSDYLPLNQMANQAQAERIRNSTLNPASAVVEDPAAARATRQAAQRAAEEARRTSTPISMPAPAPAPAAATPAPAAATPRPPAPATGAAPAAPGTAAAAPVAPAGGTAAGPVAPGTAAAPVAPGTAAPRPPVTPGTGTPVVATPTPVAPAAGTPAAGAPAASPPAAAPPAGGAAAPPPPRPPAPIGAPAPPPSGTAPAPPSAAGVGTQVGATVGGAAGTAAGGAAGGAIGGAIGGVGAVVGVPVGAAIGGAIGTAAGGLLGGTIGGAIDSGLSGTPAR